MAEQELHHAHLVYASPREQPSLEGFHWIGFDLDYTVARYHNDLCPLVQRCLIRALERSGYGPSVFESIDRTLVQKGIIIDIGTGDLIKLDAEGRVVMALHGSEWRSPESIAAVYGCGAWRLFETLRRQGSHDGFWLLVTAFDCPLIPLWARIVELMKRRAPAVAHVAQGDFAAVRRHLFDALIWIFDNTLAWESGRGSFFDALRAEPEHYILPRPGLRALLQRLRARGHTTFLATNSQQRFAEFVAGVCLGPGWQAACFDLVVYDCGKPAWFARAQQPWRQAAGAAEGVGALPDPLVRAVRVALPRAVVQASMPLVAAPAPPPPCFVGGSAECVQALADAALIVAEMAALGGDATVPVGGGDSAIAGFAQAVTAAGGGSVVAVTAHLDPTSCFVESVTAEVAPASGTAGDTSSVSVPLTIRHLPRHAPGAGSEPAGAVQPQLLPPELPAHSAARVLYCGDHLHSDMAAAAAATGRGGAGWTAMAVVEELAGAGPVGAATIIFTDAAATLQEPAADPGARDKAAAAAAALRGRGPLASLKSSTPNAGSDSDCTSPVVTRMPLSVAGTALLPVHEPVPPATRILSTVSAPAAAAAVGTLRPRAPQPVSVGASQLMDADSPWGSFFEAGRYARDRRSYFCALLERCAWAVTTDVEASLALLLSRELGVVEP